MKKIIFSLICLTLLICLSITNVLSASVSAYYDDTLFNNFTSSSYILLDVDSGTIIVNKNANEKLQVASICKLMTSLITMEKIEAGDLSLDSEILASEHAASMEGSQAFLDAGSKYKVSELLKSVIVASANDSAVALAEAIAGSEQAFVNLMNEKAKELGMNNTVYANATGLPAANQYSTAFDTTIVLKNATSLDIHGQYSNIWMDSFVHPSGRVTELVNTNRLIKYYDYCKSGKTGFTDEAGYCLSSTASNGNLNLIAVTLKCANPQDRFKESMELYNYGFANFENKKIIDSPIPFDKTIKVTGAKNNQAPLSLKNNFSALVKKGDKSEISINYEIKNVIKAPLKAGEKVGCATIVKEGKIIGEVDIVLAEDVLKASYGDTISKIVNLWGI